MSDPKWYPTHTGFLVGNDNRTDPNFKLQIELRELKLCYVDPRGRHWHKESGRQKGERFPLYILTAVMPIPTRPK